MTMVLTLRRQNHLARVVGTWMAAVLVGMGVTARLAAQSPPVHYEHAGIMPPGAIGRAQLQRGGPLPGYFQPVEIKVPAGAKISTAESGDFSDGIADSTKVGLLIGSVYRLKISGIPLQEGAEVYPTIEVIDRLYPPLGQEFRFPIPIELTQEELEMALDGKFVTRVIYLEEPQAALPVREQPDQQSYFEARDGENPLEVADTLGRPMAILRLGGRLPDADGPDAVFLFNSPPLLKWNVGAKNGEVCYEPEVAQQMTREALATSAAMPLGQKISRGTKRR